METSKIKSEMIVVYENLTKSNKEFNGSIGWVNLADFGSALRINGIDYKAEGFDKLQNFMDAHSDIFEKCLDKSQKLPVVYIKKIEQIHSLKQDTQISNTTRSKNIQRSALMAWAYLGYYPTMIEKLKNLALSEDWAEVKDEDGQIRYPGLTNYLHYTFFKLQNEGKIKLSNSEKYAVFNTGLVDRKYDSIYALFTINENKGKQPWRLLGFCIKGEDRNGKILVNHFGNDLPEAPFYFHDSKDMFYDISQGEPECDKTHIIVENVKRLPLEFVERNAPVKFNVRNPDELTEEDKEEYFNTLKEAIKNNAQSIRRFNNDLDSSVKLAIKRVKWNYKSAIPMYYPRNNRMCFLLPLCLVNDDVVDLALVVSRGDSGKYQGETIYPLDWAYSNARLVCRPDSDWLNLNNMSTFTSGEQEY